MIGARMSRAMQGAPKPLDETAAAAARARQARLTKPPGALGELEEVVIRLAAMQGRERPSADAVHIVVFAGDHGVVEEGVSAFPQAVTAEMVRNFVRGGAAVSVLAAELGARLDVVNLGTVVETGDGAGVRELRLGPGSANLARGPAMTREQCVRALDAGADSVERAREGGADIFVGGEMGIGNTTAATAIACALLGEKPSSLVGPGTGLDGAGVARKAEVIRRALALHDASLGDPFEVLRRLGGFEIAALAGAFLSCARLGSPALVDGLIATSAALLAERLCPGASQWFLYGHRSAEPGHARLLAALRARPLLDLGMRLGEGSGAAVAVPLIRLACALHARMATFGEAGVSEA
jgi:nicotinate-nucleotide--dimethylbenzimidazole phosphoribosyltransferase